jgi:hypothetical protein
MRGEFAFFGVFTPPLLVWVAVAFGANLVLRRGLRWIGAYRFVWHPALLDLALFILLLGAVSAIGTEMARP